MRNIKVKTLIYGLIAVVIIIAVAKPVFLWVADFLIDPASKVPDPGQIDMPGVR